MTRIILSILIFSGGFIFLASPAGAAISITATGSWQETIDVADLEAGAGSNLRATYESLPGAITLSISGTTSALDNWRVDVRRVDTHWPADFTLFARRTSEGTGAGSITGGLLWTEIKTIASAFFSGSGDRSDIRVQLKLSGASLGIDPDIYTTTISYTVIDIT